MEHQPLPNPAPFVQELLDKLASSKSSTPKKNISSGEDAFTFDTQPQEENV